MRGLIVIWTISALLITPSPFARAETSEQRVLLRKCCPQHQWLNVHLKHCESDPGDLSAVLDTSVSDNYTTGVVVVPASAALERWVYANLTVWDAVAGTPGQSVRQFLANDTGALVQLGPHPPCELSRRKIFTSASGRRFRLLPDGRLLLRADNADQPNIELTHREYCTDNSAQGTHVFVTCPCHKTLCINKCCPDLHEQTIEFARNRVNLNCSRLTNKKLKWLPRFMPTNGGNETVDHIVIGGNIPLCGAEYSQVGLHEPDFPPRNLSVFTNGSALVEGLNMNVPFLPEAWCADIARTQADLRVENAIVCLKIQKKKLTTTAALYGSMFAVGSVFLALTLLVYALLPELHRSAHARALLCHVATLLVGSVALASGQLQPTADSPFRCYLLAFSIQYAMLASFFWLNAVCIELARTFSETLPTILHRTNERRKFIYYSLYAWGFPLVITSITIAMEFTEDLPEYIIRPGIGKQSCWMHSTAAVFVYFYGPMAILLLANVLLYCLTVARLVHARRETAHTLYSHKEDNGRHSARSALHNPKERLAVHGKLFVLMGATWIMECVSAAVGQDEVYWYATDAVNMLRGFFVFVIFCCKRDIWRRLQGRMRECCGRGKPRDSGASNGENRLAHGARSSGDTTSNGATRLTTLNARALQTMYSQCKT